MNSYKINENVTRFAYLISIIFLLLITKPLQAQITFNCYLCNAKSETNNASFCIQVPKGQSLASSINVLKEKLENNFIVTCDSSALIDVKCSKLGTSPSAICSNDPVTVNQFDPKTTLLISKQTSSTLEITGAQKNATPKLNVPIPGLNFSETINESGQALLIPYLAQYISALQKYLIGIALIVASIMIIIGGIKYIIASTGAKVASSKEIIIDAVMGMVIVLGSYEILASINPNLTYLPSLQITQVEKSAYNLNAPIIKAEVIKIATPKNQLLMPIIDYGGTTPVVSPAEINSQPVKDAQGNYVAQGQCPEGMIMIKNSPEYAIKTKKNVKSFCMDKYEAPNMPGVKPYIGVADPEADWWCNERGKRLCTVDEFQRACLGPEGTQTVMFGTEYIPGKWYYEGKGPTAVLRGSDNNTPAPCNYDSKSDVYQTQALINAYESLPVNFTKEISVLNPDNPKLTDPKYKARYDAWKEAIEKFAKQEPSGKRINCRSAEGVYDLLANTQEIVLSETGASKTIEERMEIAKSTATGNSKAYKWAGFYWSPLHHLGVNNANVGTLPTCTVTSGSVHSSGYRTHENGFRCCLSLE